MDAKPVCPGKNNQQTFIIVQRHNTFSKYKLSIQITRLNTFECVYETTKSTILLNTSNIHITKYQSFHLNFFSKNPLNILKIFYNFSILIILFHHLYGSFLDFALAVGVCFSFSSFFTCNFIHSENF